MDVTAGGLVRGTVGSFQEMAERVDAELAFARGLCDLQKPRVLALDECVKEAEGMVRGVMGASSVETLREGVKRIEAVLAPVGKIAKQYTLYCVGHGHIDMNWMWGWPETVAVINDTMITVLKLMEEYGGFCFSQSQASIYAVLEKHNPELLARIVERVKEGRWEVTASHWVEGDRNMVSGESLTRHVLYTRQYMQKLFGLSPEDVQIDWSPDTFGHPASVPMYLVRGGIKWVYLHRPGAIGVERPGAFWWKSPDGSKVLVRNDMGQGYNGTFTGAVWKPLLKDCAETRLKFGMFVYGVGDHGGGPTRRDLSRAIEMNSWPIFPNLTLGRVRDYFSRLQAEGANLPTLACELNTELTGCYTTQALIKRSNRIAENRLTDAEAFCTLASVAAGRAYPAERFAEAWKSTLFAHFHDILPGSNVHDSRTHMHGMFQETMATTSMIETAALRAVAGLVNTVVPGMAVDEAAAMSGESVLGAGVGYGSERNIVYAAEQTAGGAARPFVIFNPTAWERAEVVEAVIWSDSPRPANMAEMRQRDYSVRTPNGDIVQSQVVDRGKYWGHGFTRLAFPVKVPGLGYATYTVLEHSVATAERAAGQTTRPHHCSYLIHERREEGIENDLVKLVLDPMTGGIRLLQDKRSGVAVIDRKGDAPLMEYLIEKPHEMSAWLIDNVYRREVPQVVAIHRKLDGPYKATLEVQLKIAESEITVTFELCAGDPRLYVHLNAMWFQRGGPVVGVPSLRMGLATMLEGAQATYEIPFGAIKRNLNNNEELPAINWAMVQGKIGGKTAGLLLANDCKHGHSLDGATLHLTLIRSAYHPDPLPDCGQHEVHLAVLPFVGDMDAASAIRAGRDLNKPLRVVSTAVHDGKLAADGSAISVDNAAIILADLKQAEDPVGVVLRLLNPTDEVQESVVRLDEALMGKFSRAVEIDLMERAIEGGALRLTGDKLTIQVPARALASVRLSR